MEVLKECVAILLGILVQLKISVGNVGEEADGIENFTNTSCGRLSLSEELESDAACYRKDV